MCRKKIVVLVLLALMNFKVPALAEDSFKVTVEESEKREAGKPIEGVVEFFENARTFQDQLAEEGIILEFGHINDTGLNFGGILSKTTSLKSMSLFDMMMTFDTERLGLWKGGTAFIMGQTIYGKGLTSNRLGDIQTVSNIDADERTQLSEFWYEQKLFDEKWRIAAGKADANGEFGILPMAEEYMGSSYTLMPNIPMPSYPDQAIGAWTEFSLSERLSIKGGIYDGGSRGDDLGFRTAFEGRDGYITLAQANIKTDIKSMPGECLFGYWTHSNDLETIATADTQLYDNNRGFYTEFQQMVYKEKGTHDQGLTVLGQFSWVPSNRNEIARYYGAGLSYKGLFSKRDDDILGFGLALADLSQRYKKAEGLQNEAAVELFYKVQINDVIALQPDVQMIINTGGSRKTSFAVGLRSIITLAPRSELL